MWAPLVSAGYCLCFGKCDLFFFERRRMIPALIDKKKADYKLQWRQVFRPVLVKPETSAETGWSIGKAPHQERDYKVLLTKRLIY